MTNEELDRLVSETREPMPKDGDRIVYSFGDDEPTTPSVFGVPVPRYNYSLNKSWRRQVTVSQTVPLYEWEPLPWTTSDHYAMRLFDEMIAAKGWMEACRMIEATSELFKIKPSPGDRRRGAVLAWLSWKGVRV